MFSVQECKTISGPEPNKPCVFPYIDNGIKHFECTSMFDNQPWCSIEVDNNGNHVTGQWGYCDTECFEGKTYREM